MSPALYCQKSIDVVTLTSPIHLNKLSSSFTIDVGFRLYDENTCLQDLSHY
uniref:Uncharacterized protein n=1 Tax=Lepeophtheirus salmonis TaxID=72036 RepID=A0A0K2U0Z9_LEPSM